MKADLKMQNVITEMMSRLEQAVEMLSWRRCFQSSSRENEHKSDEDDEDT